MFGCGNNNGFIMCYWWTPRRYINYVFFVKEPQLEELCTHKQTCKGMSVHVLVRIGEVTAPGTAAGSYFGVPELYLGPWTCNLGHGVCV